MALLCSRPARLATCLVIVCWCALFAATHVPQKPDMVVGYGLDKVFHCGGFAVLSLLCCWAIASRRKLSPAIAFGIVAALACYAALDELLQTPIPGRHADLLDWLADVAGAIGGALIFALILAIRRCAAKTSRPPAATSAAPR